MTWGGAERRPEKGQQIEIKHRPENVQTVIKHAKERSTPIQSVVP